MPGTLHVEWLPLGQTEPNPGFIDALRAVAEPMPPAALIPEAELALLQEWIECGAKGPETGQPTLCCPDPGPNDVCG